MEDAALLWQWASDPETRRNAFNKAPIPYADHLVWLEKRLESDTTQIRIFNDGDLPVGQVRFDMWADHAEISISVAPGCRERGYGRAMLTEAARCFAEEIMPGVQLRARVLAHNIASLKLFESCGFREIGVEQHGEKRAIVFEFMGASVRGARDLR